MGQKFYLSEIILFWNRKQHLKYVVLPDCRVFFDESRHTQGQIYTSQNILINPRCRKFGSKQKCSRSSSSKKNM